MRTSSYRRSISRHTTDIQLPSEITIQRSHHPHDGKTLKVVNWAHRGGILNCLVVLPDKSTMYVPAEWTDLGSVKAEKTSSSIHKQPPSNISIGSVPDLLRLRLVVDALLNPPVCLDHATSESVCKEEKNRAIEVATSKGKKSTTANGVARTRSRSTGKPNSGTRENIGQVSRSGAKRSSRRRTSR